MTQDEITSMAQDACSPHQVLNSDPEFLKRFFKLAFSAGASNERSIIREKFWSAVNDCITTNELGVEFMNKFYEVHVFGHWLDGENK